MTQVTTTEKEVPTRTFLIFGMYGQAIICALLIGGALGMAALHKDTLAASLLGILGGLLVRSDWGRKGDKYPKIVKRRVQPTETVIITPEHRGEEPKT